MLNLHLPRLSVFYVHMYVTYVHTSDVRYTNFIIDIMRVKIYRIDFQYQYYNVYSFNIYHISNIYY